MTSEMKTPDPLLDGIRADARDASTASWWLVALGALWIWFGMFVLSYQVGSLVAVASCRWKRTSIALSMLVAWYLIVFGAIHLVSALAGPKLSWWWTGLLLGISELMLGVWAARSWEHSLATLVTLVGVWAICRGVNEIFAGFSLRQVGKQADRLVA